MTTHDDIRTICAKLAGSIEGDERFGFSVLVGGKLKGYAWTWAERIHPRKPKVINDQVLAVRTPNLQAKEMLLQSEARFLFTEPHYDGFPAVLVRLDDVDPSSLEELLIEAHQCTLNPIVKTGPSAAFRKKDAEKSKP